ncbi:MAG: hypothetical protein ACE5E4_00720 [Candidatus Binatia bacterium]
MSVLLASCTPVSRYYEIHTGELSCEEANRFVHDALIAMKMRITAFRLATPGRPGYLRATRTGPTGTISGEVKINCDPDGVHIVPREDGLGGEQYFARGIFLSVTGRSGISVASIKRGSQGDASPQAPAPTRSAPPGGPSSSQANRRRAVEKKVVGVSVKLEPIYGFATVLDFEANLGAVGLLPVRVSLVNGTERYYLFDPADLVLRRGGSRLRAYPLSAAQAIGRLRSRAAASVGDGGDSQPQGEESAAIGDVAAAAATIKREQLGAARLAPGQKLSGFVYYDLGRYDRARLTLVDVATGETEGFIVELEAME